MTGTIKIFKITVLAAIPNVDGNEKLGRPLHNVVGKEYVNECRLFTETCLSVYIPGNNCHWPIVTTRIS